MLEDEIMQNYAHSDDQLSFLITQHIHLFQSPPFVFESGVGVFCDNSCI